jgi:hypothetical protein
MAAELQRHRLGLSWIEQGGTVRTGHALRESGRVWLVDPFEDPAALAVAAELGPPAGVIQLLDRHNRDCAAIAARLGVTHLRVPDHVPDTPFEIVPIISGRLWNEVALWWPQERALVVAEAIGTAPMFALGRTAGMHPLLRLTPPRARLSRWQPQTLLVGHGRTLEYGGGEAVQEALAHARGDIPKLLISLPKLAHGG